MYRVLKGQRSWSVLKGWDRCLVINPNAFDLKNKRKTSQRTSNSPTYHAFAYNARIWQWLLSWAGWALDACQIFQHYWWHLAHHWGHLFWPCWRKRDSQLDGGRWGIWKSEEIHISLWVQRVPLGPRFFRPFGGKDSMRKAWSAQAVSCYMHQS